MPTTDKRPLKVFPSTGSGHRLCHAHADRDPVPQGDDMRGLDGRVAQRDFRWAYRDHTRLTKDGVDAWLDKENLPPGQDWELEIRKAVHEKM